MLLRIPIGISDFRELREKGLEYVDKSRFIIEMLDQAGAQVLLLPRPRRFGKTLNLSMLRYFFEKRAEDLSHLFEDLAIWRAGDVYRAHFQRYPVISMTFREVKASTYEECWADLRKKVEVLFREHQSLLEADVLGEGESKDYRAILEGTAEPVLYRRALGDLSKYLHRTTGQKAILLIDEYDEPIHAGYIHGYAAEVLEFFRAFLSAGLKDNPHLERAVVTGILRVARESIFSGLNNLAVYSLLRSEFSSCFGFTEPEVEVLLEKAGRSTQLEIVRGWYNGYDFGGTVVYNPWSVLNFLADSQGEARPYWLNTSSNDLIKQSLEIWGPRVEPVMEALLEGGGVERVLDENVALGELEHSEEALFSLLVFSGYLKAEKRSRGPGEQAAHFLSIPNREVRLLYAGTFRSWMRRNLIERGGNADRLLKALLSGDAETLEDQLQALAEAVVSHHDVGIRNAEPFYHGFILGLLTLLEEDYELRSNRESGLGRPDVMIRPRRPGKAAIVLELKVARRGKSLDKALEEGLAQIAEKEYVAELASAGASQVHAFAIAFDGKEVRVQAVPPVP